MFLSLFLLLLAFFILLNTLSTREETKARKVINSVSSTFRTKVDFQKDPQVFISSLGPIPEPTEVLDEVERLWMAAIPLAKVDVMTDEGVLEMEFEAGDIFVGGSQTVRADRKPLLKSTVAALSARIDGFVTELQFLVGVDDLTRVKSTLSPGATITEDTTRPSLLDLSDPLATIAEDPFGDRRNLAFLRATTFAASLQDLGAPPSGISVGLLRGDANRIRMRFYIRPQARAFNRFLDIKE
ncbi:hypothetical protein [Aestuariispira ectoiniformans]|uniref:hypothetical protein n=1 Tax=Aestuariispira ectoiniformans TaxID=2775080 RepID=UPI00223C381C|nr:hypothetical protein [Aestuariispira ectoiniformans]